MTRLDRLILSEIVAPFLGSALLFTSLFFAGGDLLRFAGYLQGGAGAWMVAQMIFFRFPMILALTFPMAMLLGVLLGFARLSGDSEIVALVAAGISFERIVVPVALFGFFVSLIGYWFNQNVVPTANARGEALVTEFKNRNGANFASAEPLDFTLRDDKNMTILHAEGGIDPASVLRGDGSIELRNVSIEQWQNNIPVIVSVAERADWIVGTKRWQLHDGKVIYLGSRTVGAGVQNVSGLETVPVNLDTPSNLSVLQLPVEQVTTANLRIRADVLRRGGNVSAAREADVEIARRMSLPFASLMFALIGAPLGVTPKRAGKGMGFGLSILITFAYWMAMQTLSIVSRGGLIPPSVALAIPNIVCLVVALLLNRRVLRS